MGVWAIIDAVADNVETFVVCFVLFGSIILCGALDIEQQFETENEKLEPFKKRELHQEDIKLPNRFLTL